MRLVDAEIYGRPYIAAPCPSVRVRFSVGASRVSARPKNEFVGVVLAPDKDTAIELAIEEHRIEDPEKQRRLVAWLED